MDKPVKCEMCGEKIPRLRLKILPNTTLCVSCAAEDERQRGIQYGGNVGECDSSELFDIVSPDD